MKENISPEVLAKIEILLKDIPAETNVVEIPDASGMKVVRIKSKEFDERSKKFLVMIFRIPGHDDFVMSTE